MGGFCTFTLSPRASSSSSRVCQRSVSEEQLEIGTFGKLTLHLGGNESPFCLKHNSSSRCGTSLVMHIVLILTAHSSSINDPVGWECFKGLVLPQRAGSPLLHLIKVVLSLSLSGLLSCERREALYKENPRSTTV